MEESEDQFYLDDDENYDKICGEVMLTTKKKLVIFCTICEAKYQGFEDYINHVFLNHETDLSDEYEEKPDIKEISPDEVWEDDIIDCSDETTTIDFEIEPLGNDALKETDMPYNSLKEPTNIIQDNTSDKTPDKESSEYVTTKPQNLQQRQSQKDSNNEFVMPAEIREVAKRITYIGKVIPDEERIHKCPICGLGFNKKYNLNYHFKRHSTNEKKHACPECGKKFFEYAEVRAHMRFHSSKREYLCNDCGKAFRTSHMLTKHIKRHKNQRDYKCPNCDKAFFENTALQSHIRTHTLERPFCCRICNATFARPTALRNHKKLHENKRGYKCNLCDAAFNQAAGLFSHMKGAHKAT